MPIADEWDVVTARIIARDLCRRLPFSAAATDALVTAVSEVARNIAVHGGAGELRLEIVEEAGKGQGIEVVASDCGPGIADVEQAMRDGYSSGNGLGLGLPSARRLTDDFQIESGSGSGTIVRMKKWAQ